MPGYQDSPKHADGIQTATEASKAQPSGASKSSLTDTTKSIIFQAIIKSVIGTCAPKDEWEGMVDHAKFLHDKKVKEW